jgi:hypothetical protein
MLAGWDRDEYPSKAEAGRAHRFDKADATRLINAHEPAKVGKKSRP